VMAMIRLISMIVGSGGGYLDDSAKLSDG